MSEQRGEKLLRMAAEFVVIVLGVLGALVADQWVQDWEDRALEAEYLERLRADAGYDREEIEFIRDVTDAGIAAADSLLNSDYLDRASDLDLVGNAILAAAARQIDLSRGTWQELVASGRIALLREAEVRLALADYDRFVREIAGYWEYTDNDLWAWVTRRIPAEVQDAWDDECAREGARRYSTSQAVSVCELPLPVGLADGLRAELRSETAIGELRLQRRRYQGLQTIVTALLERVIELERVLEDAR